MADRSLHVFYSGDKITVDSITDDTITLLIHRHLVSRHNPTGREKIFKRICTATVWDKDRTDHVPIARTLVPGQQFVRNSAKFM